ncbi:hypothetical protein [Algoriphagus yeomjeoni]|uniref:Uncharacterized protein n=1 Tax=Algoriphagus yeomjeoni TaxID=291403 RepID=A0A327PKF6_9BACT|nr:hypothetical protein [Algoriphagus yeomjeoni]RAI92037.1 hypothetical protein LV83_01263 [Algoriphagus yeomjeoni]
MKTPKLTLETKTFDHKKASGKEFLDSMNEYFIKSPTNYNLGDRGFVNGHVNFKERTFYVSPIISDFWLRSFMITTQGIVTDTQIKVDFQTSAFSFLLPTIFYALFISVFFSKAWISIAWLTTPIMVVLLIINILRVRNQYRKDRQNHIDFLNRLNVS